MKLFFFPSVVEARSPPSPRVLTPCIGPADLLLVSPPLTNNCHQTRPSTPIRALVCGMPVSRFSSSQESDLDTQVVKRHKLCSLGTGEVVNVIHYKV